MLALSKSHWRPRFGYLFDIASTCHQSRGPSKFAKLSWNQFEHIFPTFFSLFYVNAARRRFGEVIKLLNELVPT